MAKPLKFQLHIQLMTKLRKVHTPSIRS